ncbi:MAG: polyhydroxyalkanoic acid system family protein [Bdellovibrionales bacterium]|nr:polyhydroxyalkanoic acid system family protein [Bdellovibrionales bacterium]
MPSFNKTFPVPGQAADKIYSVISTGIDHFLSKTPLGQVQVDRNEGSKQVSFKSNMASGTLTAKDNALSVEVSLSLLATPFKGKIEEGVTRWLSKAFGNS